jgi:hypothetical protein
MSPDAYLYIHRAEQAARDRAHLRDADRPPRASRSWLRRLRDTTGRRPGRARRRARAALSPR